MSTQRLRVPVSPHVAAPRGPRWSARVARIALGLSHLGEAVWCTLEEIGRRRAARELEHIAQLYEYTDPVLARRLRRESGVGTTN